jgi:hypothetical protein
LNVGVKLAEGDRVRTGSQGFASLEFDDGTRVVVGQDTTITLDRLRKSALTGTRDEVILLDRGYVDNEVTHATIPDSRFQIRTPSVVAGVRGTQFRMNYDSAAHTAAVEVIEGAVRVDARARAADAQAQRGELIPAKFGVVAHDREAVGAPVALLAAPTLVNPENIQDKPTVVFDFLGPEGERGYRVQIGRDAGLLDVIREQRVTTSSASFGNLPDGTYYLRAAAIDSEGLAGLPQTWAFERRQFRLDTSSRARDGTRNFEFRWIASRDDTATRYRFVLAASADLSSPIVDEPDIVHNELVVSKLQRGVYYWAVMATQFANGRFYEKYSPVQSFTVSW